MLDADRVQRLRALIGRLAAQDGEHGSAAVAEPALRAFRAARQALIDRRYRPGLGRELATVTAELGELSGWLLFDAERHTAARRVNASALTLARAAGADDLAWFVLSNQALASLHTGRPAEALRIADRATEAWPLPGRVRALFDVRAARALAALGAGPAALRRFDRARSGFADGVGPRDPAWSWWFDERELIGHAGMVHTALGDWDRGLPALADAVAQSVGRQGFQWAAYLHRAHLLTALLRAGRWADAEPVAAGVLPMIGTVASARTVTVLRGAVAASAARRTPSTLAGLLHDIGRAVT